MIYSKKVMEYFKKPKFNKKIKNPNGTGKMGNPTCGDVMQVFIKVKDNKISDIGYNTYGCVAAIASSESLCKLAKGKTIQEAEKITNEDIRKDLGEMPTEKFHCSVLGMQTLRDAIKDYKKKVSVKA